ncbi:MAG: hypothetical protein QM820_57665 [Minicystis sp.]
MGKNDEQRKPDGETSSAETTSMAAAAAALEAELESFETLATTLRKMPLGSKKHLERAARSLQEAAGYEERLAVRLHALVGAINAASQRQQASAAAIVARAKEIEARNNEYTELFAQYATLGGEAQELTAIAQEIVGPVREMTSPEQIDQIGGRIDELLGRMASLGERAQEIARTATAQDMGELAKHADALKQQIAAARNKLSLLRQSQQRRAQDRSN